ncbi:hypothetical protein NP590_04015 [Methylomonas sp. SURF-2]|uniref:DUF3102 domain-containing protein n=1 Tax=Methylomonas subterranea TaxID=2952225 RepID=A0ABT1TDA6_9GAMM|nr:hypothetical protein [Methylomonas sp. SURF-2]MCQ8103263.1 hypothetical protein [Methylomonas sp. SURF-2]
MAEIDFELDMGELPSVKTFVDGELVDLDSEQKALTPAATAEQAQLQLCLREFGLLDMDVNGLMAVGIEELNTSMLKACKAGVAFWSAQQTIKNEDYAGGAVANFKEWIDKSGLVEARVYECIRLAKYYARLPENQRGKMLSIGKKQALLLAKMPQEVIDSVAENGTDILDEAETMTYDQLRDLLKQEQRKSQQKDTEIEHRDALIDRMKQRDNRDYEFHWKTHTVREECLAYQAECEVALNSLQAVFNEQLNDIELTEKDLRIEQLWVTANVIAARAATVMEYIRLHSLVDLPSTITSKHMLSDDEAQRWLLDYPLIERKHEAAKAKREDARPKRPGRPSKKDK